MAMPRTDASIGTRIGDGLATGGGDMISEQARERLRRACRTAAELDRLERSFDSLDARAAELEVRLARYGRYVLALEADGFEVLMDARLFWGPPKVIVRWRGRTLEVWLDPEDTHVLLNRGFSDVEERRALNVVRDHMHDLEALWYSFRNDWKMDRLERLPWVD
jgi:hypothetical protein